MLSGVAGSERGLPGDKALNACIAWLEGEGQKVSG